MWVFVLMLLIIAVCYHIANKKYKKTEYCKQTRNTLISIWLDKGKLGEYKIFEYLEALNGDKKYLFNLYLPKDGDGTTEIDVVLLHESGIYVFESKNYSGWIFGTETQKNWTQTLPLGRGKTQKNHFYNPILQNKGHIKWLKAYLQDDSLPFFSCIVFSERCTLKDIKLTSTEHAVIQRFDVLNTVKRSAATHPLSLTKEQLDSLYQRLYPLTQVGESVKLEHIQKINENTSEQTLAMAPPVETENKALLCPRCGADLVLRTASRGKNTGNQFYGCSNYPNCRYIQAMETQCESAQQK